MQEEEDKGCCSVDKSKQKREALKRIGVVTRFEGSDGVESAFELKLDVPEAATAAWLLHAVRDKLHEERPEALDIAKLIKTFQLLRRLMSSG